MKDMSPMEWTIEYLKEHQHFMITTSGSFDLIGHGRMVVAITSHPEWRRDMPICFDHRELDFSGSDFRSMSSASQTHQQHDDKIGKSRSAIVMGPGAAYGTGRQFQMISEAKISAMIHVFADLDEGLAWLRNPDLSTEDN